jgi:hypothetical protein
MRRVVAGLVLASSAAWQPAAAQAVPAYAAGTSRFKTLAVSEITQEAMGETQKNSNTTYREATLTIAKAGAGLDITVRLDTTHLTTSQGGASSQNLKGLTWKAATSPGGVPTTSTVTDAVGAESKLPIAANLRVFLPRLKPGATRGQSWTDSVTAETFENGLTVTTTTAYTYTYASDTTVNGTRLLSIGIASNGKQGGAGDTPNGKLSLEGTVSSAGTAWVTPAGQLFGVSTVTKIARTILVEEQGVAVTVNQTSTLNTTRLP